MDKPFKQITSFKSADDLREYLENNPKLNLSLLEDKNGATLLHFASFKNDLVKMKIYFQHFKAYCEITHGNKMYESGFEAKVKSWINKPNQEGLTAIHFAALQGNIDMIRLLENLGANMEFITNDGENVLFMAVQNNQIKTLIYLLEESQNRLDITSTNSIGDNLLHKAARKNYILIISYLLTKKISANHQNNEGFTPLMEAVMANYKEIVKSLLLMGCDRHVKNNEGQQAIDIAIKQDRKDLMNILNDDFTFGEKLKIACNVKIVYRVEKPTITYELMFLFLYNLVILPTCILTEFTAFGSDKFYIPIIGQGLYYLLTMIIFILLTRKHPKKIPSQSLMNLEIPFCAECRNQKKNEFHCYICGTCVYRYDHHCPWINNCIGVKNIGKFYVFLWLIEFGTIYVIFCHLFMLGLNKNFIRYRDFSGIEPQEKGYSFVCILLAIFFAISIFFLIVKQTKNLMSNTTQFERSKKQKQKPKVSQTRSQPDTLLSEDNLQTKSFLDKSDDEDKNLGCFANCKIMLCDGSDRF